MVEKAGVRQKSGDKKQNLTGTDKKEPPGVGEKLKVIQERLFSVRETSATAHTSKPKQSVRVMEMNAANGSHSQRDNTAHWLKEETDT